VKVAHELLDVHEAEAPGEFGAFGGVCFDALVEPVVWKCLDFHRSRERNFVAQVTAP